MYYTINQQIIQARAADLHRQAQQDALARRCPPGPPGRQAPVRAWHAPAPPHHRAPRAHRLGRPRLTGTGGPASGSTHMCRSAPAGKLRRSRELRPARGIDAIGGRAPQALLPGQGRRPQEGQIRTRGRPPPPRFPTLLAPACRGPRPSPPGGSGPGWPLPAGLTAGG